MKTSKALIVLAVCIVVFFLWKSISQTSKESSNDIQETSETQISEVPSLAKQKSNYSSGDFKDQSEPLNNETP